MTYLDPAAFRLPSLAEYCAGLALTDDEAETSRLTASISRQSDRFDRLTNDHFETQTATTLTLRGNGTSILDLPRRTTAITSVTITNYAGTATVQASTYWRLHSSLNSTGSAIAYDGALDWLEVIPWQYLTGLTSGSGSYWPDEPNSVTVVGTFGWTVTPADVKRAVALLVYDQFKPEADILRRANQLSDAGSTYQLSTSGTGIPEVDAIVDAYSYARSAVMIG